MGRRSRHTRIEWSRHRGNEDGRDKIKRREGGRIVELAKRQCYSRELFPSPDPERSASSREDLSSFYLLGLRASKPTKASCESDRPEELAHTQSGRLVHEVQGNQTGISIARFSRGNERGLSLTKLDLTTDRLLSLVTGTEIQRKKKGNKKEEKEKRQVAVGGPARNSAVQKRKHFSRCPMVIVKVIYSISTVPQVHS